LLRQAEKVFIDNSLALQALVRDVFGVENLSERVDPRATMRLYCSFESERLLIVLNSHLAHMLYLAINSSTMKDKLTACALLCAGHSLSSRLPLCPNLLSFIVNEEPDCCNFVLNSRIEKLM
jgi:hypothetical protein